MFRESQNTALLVWLLISLSAALIMAQDTVAGWNNPRLNTTDATAEFTKILVIHSLWAVTTVVFLIFTFYFKPTKWWLLHTILAALVLFWAIGVIAWSFRDVDRLTISTWSCTAAPTSDHVDEEFLSTCELTNAYSDIRLGQDIFMWSIDDKHHWRWIVPGQGRASLQTPWPIDANGIYLAANEPNAELMHQAEDSAVGEVWRSSFNPQQSTDLNLFYIDSADESDAEDDSTPEASLYPGYHAHVRTAAP